MYLVDTSVISARVPSRVTPAEMTDWMDANSAKLFLSVVTVAEIEDGISTGAAVAGRPQTAEPQISSQASAPAAPPAPPAPAPFTFRVMLGLIGVLVSSFNEHVIEVALGDIQGAKNAEFK